MTPVRSHWMFLARVLQSFFPQTHHSYITLISTSVAPRCTNYMCAFLLLVTVASKFVLPYLELLAFTFVLLEILDFYLYSLLLVPLNKDLNCIIYTIQSGYIAGHECMK
jgi:hypothetical protein